MTYQTSWLDSIGERLVRQNQAGYRPGTHSPLCYAHSTTFCSSGLVYLHSKASGTLQTHARRHAGTLRTHARIHTRTHAHTDTHRHTQRHTHTHTHTHTEAHTQAHTHTSTHRHTHTHPKLQLRAASLPTNPGGFTVFHKCTNRPVLPCCTVTVAYLYLLNLHEVLGGLPVGVAAGLQALHVGLHPPQVRPHPLLLCCCLLHSLLPDGGNVSSIRGSLPSHRLLHNRGIKPRYSILVYCSTT